MTDQLYYLKEEVYFEPLIHNWYAWPYMLPPIQSALIFSKRITGLMKSFVKNAQLHVTANKSKQLTGGSFVNCTVDQVEDVKRLLDTLETEYQHYHQIKDAFTRLNDFLEQNADGYALEKEYHHIDEILSGYIELVYNENHNGFARLIEGLLYLSPLYRKEAQSISFGLLSKVGERPFVLSTPRLPDENHLQLQVAFDNPQLNDILQLRQQPKSKADIQAMFAQFPSTGGLDLAELLTTQAPCTQHQPVTQGSRIRFIGHAGLCIESDGLSILVDPVIPSRTTAQAEDFLSFADLPEKIDYICVTHTHMDHVCLETLLQLRHKVDTILVPRNNSGTITDPSLKLMLSNIGFNVREMDDMEQINLPQGIIRAIPFLGEHADLNIRSKTAWWFEFNGKKIFAAADSSNLDAQMYRNIHRSVGDVDFLFIGMECVGAPMSWLYGAFFTKPIPRKMDQSRRFNGSGFETAKTLVDIFNPQQVYVYALALEPYFNYFMGLNYAEDSEQIIESDKLLAYCSERQIPCDRLSGSRIWQY